MSTESETTEMLPLAPSDPNLPDPWKRMEELDKNSIFDVLAKYYDAQFDKFLVQRFANCIHQDGKTFWCSPFAKGIFPPSPDQRYVLEENGYRPIMWMPLPNNPKELT